MIPCRFVYQFPSGGASDTLNQLYEVHDVPKVGETLYFLNNEELGPELEVKEVMHYINTEDLTHQIFVYYGDPS